jgi:ureidoglycolate lyase
MCPAARTLRAQPLTAAAFASFGTVIEAGRAPGRPVNQGRGRRIEGARDLPHQDGTTPVIDLYQIAPSQLPFAVDCLERHPLSCQIFTPMTCVRYLVVVAPSDAQGGPVVSGAVAFVASGAQAVCYDRGVWHAPMIALDAPALMTMTMWEAGSSADCEEVFLSSDAGLIVEG